MHQESISAYNNVSGNKIKQMLILSSFNKVITQGTTLSKHRLEHGVHDNITQLNDFSIILTWHMPLSNNVFYVT